MGRVFNTAVTTKEAKRLDINWLFKTGYMGEGCLITGSLSWSSNGRTVARIAFESNLVDTPKFIRLIYTVTDKETGTKEDFDYKIYLHQKQSNLGKGHYYYFICPVTGMKARILYMAYGYKKFKHRNAYKNRIYYDCQSCSKRDYFHTRYFDLEKEYELLTKKRINSFYKGTMTRSEEKRLKLITKIDKFDRLRYLELVKFVNKTNNKLNRRYGNENQ